MSNWRKNIDPLIKDHLESLVKESYRHRNAYKLAKNTANAQLWCSMALLQKQVFDLNLKVKFLEKALMELSQPKKMAKDEVDAAKELKAVLSKL